MLQHEDMLKGFNHTAEIQVFWKTCEDVCLQQSDVHPFQDLMSRLITLYSQILEYQARVVNHLSKDAQSRAKDELTGQHDWKALAESVADLDSEMRDKPLYLVDKSIIYKNWEINRNQLDESNGFLEEIQRLTLESVDLLKASVNIQKTAEENELLKTLSSTLYEEGLSDVGDRVPNTCEWFFESPGFLKWRDIDTSGILWVSALPGCGKSVLAKYLIKKSRLTTKLLTTNIAHFFFKDGTERTSKTRAMRALLWQLLIKDPTGELIPHAASLRSAKANDSLGNNFEELWKLLEHCALLPACGDIILVIDALDECSKADRNDFIRALENFFSAKATDRSINLKLFITSRPLDEFNLDSPASKLFKHTIHIPFSRISKKEIGLVVEARMNELDRLDQGARAKISNHLTNMEAHTYLVIDLTITFIKDNQDCFGEPDEIDEQLRDLPTQTFKWYEKLLDPIGRDDYRKQRSSRLLHIVYGAVYPLTLQEANYALKLALKHRPFDSHQKLKSSLFLEDQFQNNIKKWTGFMVDVYDGKLNFIHQTAREFLNPSSQRDGEQCKEREDSNNQWYHTSRKGAHLLMFNICWEYLFNIGWEYLSTEYFDHGIHLSLDYPLLRYASEAWLDHAMASDPDSLEAIDLAKTPTLRDLWFLRAAKEGKDQTVAQLHKQGASVDINDKRLRSPLSLAAEGGHETVVKLLLEAKANVDSKDSDGRTPLWLAAEVGHEAVVKLLLEAKADVDSKDSHHSRTPLSYAAERGHEAVVKLLLNTGKVDVDSKDSYHGRTPLLYAAERGHEAVVKLLQSSSSL
jgi:ankyrin repeat domain-containing protein 50